MGLHCCIHPTVPIDGACQEMMPFRSGQAHQRTRYLNRQPLESSSIPFCLARDFKNTISQVVVCRRIPAVFLNGPPEVKLSCISVPQFGCRNTEQVINHGRFYLREPVPPASIFKASVVFAAFIQKCFPGVLEPPLRIGGEISRCICQGRCICLNCILRLIIFLV